jgi:CheY-like chemotaxis protein
MLWLHMARLFVCDDDGAYRALLKLVLTQDGEHEIVGEAEDGRECVELAARARPDVILLDLNMPGMGGFDALPRLRESVPDAKVIALTTARADDKELDFLDLGGVAFIEKPHEILALPGALRRVLAAATDSRLDLVADMFRLWWSGEREEALKLFADDVEFKPLRSDRVYSGIGELKAWVNLVSERDAGATVSAEQLLLSGDDVVLLATAAVPRQMPDGTRYTERFPIAWVVGVRNGKVASIRTCSSWEEAKSAAGMERGRAPDLERKLARGAWRWALAGLSKKFISALGPPQIRFSTRSTSA